VPEVDDGRTQVVCKLCAATDRTRGESAESVQAGVVDALCVIEVRGLRAHPVPGAVRRSRVQHSGEAERLQRITIGE
jgi:hypothetical protein